MSGGPFRDTLTPLIDEAQRRLAELRQRRAAIEINYEHARQRLDEKTALAPSPEAPLLEVTNEEEPIAPPPAPGSRCSVIPARPPRDRESAAQSSEGRRRFFEPNSDAG